MIAGRLANLDPKLKVLLIEAGENNINNPWIYRPGIFPRNMKLDSKTASFYQAKRTLFRGSRSRLESMTDAEQRASISWAEPPSFHAPMFSAEDLRSTS